MRDRAAALPLAGWLLLLFPLFLLLHGLTDFGLLNNVEGMYAEIGREMLAGGHWIIPALNDVPYIEKPPLLYWLLALSMGTFGVHDWAVRLVPVCAGLLTLGVVGWFSGCLGGKRYALLSAFILGTSMGFVMMSRIAYTDTLLSALLNAALLLTYCAVTKRGGKWHLRMAVLCLALAILTKGFVALALYGLISIAWLVCCRRAIWRDTLRPLFDPWAIVLFFAVLLPWHVAAALTLPEFSWFYFINEHLYRFIGIREPRDYYTGSVFYYAPRIILMTLPWFPLFFLLPVSWRSVSPSNRDVRIFLACCVLVPLLFFSLSSGKANYYALVCMPALALLMAIALHDWLIKRNWLQWRTTGIGLLLLGVAMVAVEQYGLRYMRENEPHYSARPMALEIQRRAAAGETLPVLLYQDFENLSALSFYLQSPLGIVDSRSDDLLFGQRLGAGKARFVSSEAMLAHCAAPHAIWLVVSDQRQSSFALSPLARIAAPVSAIGKMTLYHVPGVC